jgi:hypothetical protein
MKVGDLVRYKDSLRDDVGIIMEILQSEGSCSIFGHTVIVQTPDGIRRSYTEKNLEILNARR